MKKHSDLRRLSSIPDKITDILSNKAQSVVLTNQNEQSLKTLEKPDNEDHYQIYENDFDLYILLKEMLNSKLAKDTNDDRPTKKKRKNQFKNYKKLLTATLLPTHYVDGQESWELVDNGFDLYRTRIKCIGTNLEDCGLGEPVFLDLQPLSTRIELMCKLIIIIQGACLERSGPPKLVQDRCIQFDGCDKVMPGSIADSSSKINRIKSISCETLISDTGFSDITFNDTEIKISISSSSQSAMTNKSISDNKLSKNKRHLAFSDGECINDDENVEHDLSYDIGLKLNRYPVSEDAQEAALSSSYDMEHYFKYRMAKSSLIKDYASATYYQYSSNNKDVSESKEVNTDESFIKKLKCEVNYVKSFVDKATSTHGADFFGIDNFSKRQILSPKSLYDENANQVDATADTTDTGFKTYKLQTNSLLDYIIAPMTSETLTVRHQTDKSDIKQSPIVSKKFISRHEIPIGKSEDDSDKHLFANKETYSYTHKQEYLIKLKKSVGNNKTALAQPEINSKAEITTSENPNNVKLVQASTIKTSNFKVKDQPKLKMRSKVTSSSRPRSWMFKFTNCIESGDDDENKRLAAIKAGPKKSHEWSLFKSKSDNDDENDDTEEATLTSC